MPHETTTVRVSRRTQQVLRRLAVQRGRSVSDLLDELAEKARRQDILDRSGARLAQILADPDERRSYVSDLEQSEAAAADAMRREPPYQHA